MSRARPPKVFADGGLYTRAVLACARPVGQVLSRFGVDPDGFRMLLALELNLELRRARSARRRGGGGMSVAGKVVSSIVSVGFGVFGGVALGNAADPLWGMGIALGLLMLFLTMMLVSEYLPALVDTAGIEVLAPLPVDDRSVLAARITHLAAYLGTTLLFMSLVPLLAGTVRYGAWPFVPVWVVAGLLATATSLGLSFALFLAAMRLFDPQRFRDVLIYLQVAVMVVLMGGFQLIPRLMERDALRALLGTRPRWLALVPPFHGAAFLPLARGETDGFLVLLAGLAVFVPFGTLALALRLGKRGFVARLAAMAGATRGAPVGRPRRRRLRDLLLHSPVSRAGYDFFAALSRRERGFRLRTYPLVAIAVLMGLSFAFRRGHLANPAMLCGMLYCLAMYAPAFVLQARFSDDHEARWIFSVVPVSGYGPFVQGAFTALVATFLLPIAAVFLIVVVVLGGPGVLPDAAFALQSVLLLSVISMLLLGLSVPFTEEQRKRPAEGRVGTMFLMMFLAGILVGVHVLVRLSPVVFGIALAGQTVSLVFLIREIGQSPVRPLRPWGGVGEARPPRRRRASPSLPRPPDPSR